MSQLRPLLIANEFVGRVQAQQAEGYQLASLEYEGRIVSVAGFRVQNMLSSGKTFYVDDLVTDANARSKGHGEAMIQWLIALAREASCDTFSLDSGTHRMDAHAFYLRNRLRITSFHFSLPLK
jgi:GNAT superfamily N-acetyltransferase